MSSLADLRASSPFYGGNAAYLEELYQLYQENPASVSELWRERFGSGLTPATFASSPQAAPTGGAAIPTALPATRSTAAPASVQMAVARLIDSYRSLGCRKAKVDPLSIDIRTPHPALLPNYWGLTESDLDRTFESSLPGLQSGSLRAIIAQLERTYCGTLTTEFEHLSDPRALTWLRERFEGCQGQPSYPKAEKLRLLDLMIAADVLENYLNTRYAGQKRFSLEGSDALIPLLDTLVEEAARAKMAEAVIGMAHRGRLNVLINILGKSPQMLFEEFEGKSKPTGSGDVKYHMGFSSKICVDGHDLHLALAFNPSHLEIVNPVVEGSVRARQDRRNDANGSKVLPILIHGDAAIAGQGVGMETLNMSLIRGYGTGGTIHVVINNQIGFTTSHLDDARSTYWCTDLAKMAEVPVFHVSGDDPEAVALATRMAFEYRQEFHTDVFIDMISYRRLGHNEQDEPMVTQPFMYSKIATHPQPIQVYREKLLSEGVITEQDFAEAHEKYLSTLKEGKSTNPKARIAEESDFVDWNKHLPDSNSWDSPCDTTISPDDLRNLGSKLSSIPENFIAHSRLNKIIEARRQMAQGEIPIDWGMAENLAYAKLLSEGLNVRISGQDVGRGTFFHRHATWHNQNRSDRKQLPYFPLANLTPNQGSFDCFDSFLSEEAVLGFEYGYSTTNPKTMVIWEAQFGDFANGAQVVIDQFISSGEFKWGRYCGLVMLLPHGYEGQGPEHSSARLERYMQLCAEYNMQIVVPTTAAQIYHVLCRQGLRTLRRPLIIMSPKSLLRHKDVASPAEEFTSGTFQPLIGEVTTAIRPARVRKIIACCGKIYYELKAERERHNITDIALLRIEQIYPFPHEEFKTQINKYPDANSVLWCQEEPGNQGGYHRIQHYLRRHMWKNQRFEYALRRSSASTAAGKPSEHKLQQAEVISSALDIKIGGPKHRDRD